MTLGRDFHFPTNYEYLACFFYLFFRMQAVDAHRGVCDALDDEIKNLLMLQHEVESCQRLSAGPCFVVTNNDHFIQLLVYSQNAT